MEEPIIPEPIQEAINQIPEIAHPKEPKVSAIGSTIERNKRILERYCKGDKIMDIANEHGISQVRVWQIIGKNKALVKLDKEVEKVRRINRLKKLEQMAPKNLAPKDAKDLVAVLEAQRKELEPENDPRPSQTINVQINALQIDGKSQSELWEMTRKLIEGTPNT